MPEFKQIQVGYDDLPNAMILHTTEHGLVDRNVTLLKGTDYEVLRITLSNGKRIEIDLFERETGMLTIRADHHELTITPRSSNSIDVGPK